MRVTFQWPRSPRVKLQWPSPQWDALRIRLPKLRRPWWTRWPRPRWTWAWAAVGLYVLLRGLCLLATALWAAPRGHDLWSLLGAYDAVWYADIAHRGYNEAIALRADYRPAQTNLAFFPLFPRLTGLADPILPGGSAMAGIIVAWVAGAVAAAGLFAVGNRVRGRGAGILLAALWGVVPHAFVESMGYPETLFTALAAWSLFAVLSRRWLTAGLLCAAAGLTRPTGAALVVVVGLAALFAVLRRRDGWRPWVAGVVAPLGLLGYVAWVGYTLDRWDGYFWVQDEVWNLSMGTGDYTIDRIDTYLTTPGPLAVYVVILILVVALALVAITVADRMPWPLVLYSFLVLIIAVLGDNYFNSKARLLLPAFPLLLPIATALARGRRSVAVVVLVLLTVVSAGYGIYLSVVWGYSP